MAREADIRYQPLCKDLASVVCFPVDDAEDRRLAEAILDRLINDYDRRS